MLNILNFSLFTNLNLKFQEFLNSIAVFNTKNFKYNPTNMEKLVFSKIAHTVLVKFCAKFTALKVKTVFCNYTGKNSPMEK